MAIYIKSRGQFKPVQQKDFDLEKDIQKLTEENLEIIFVLKFISGYLAIGI